MKLYRHLKKGAASWCLILIPVSVFCRSWITDGGTARRQSADDDVIMYVISGHVFGGRCDGPADGEHADSGDICTGRSPGQRTETTGLTGNQRLHSRTGNKHPSPPTPVVFFGWLMEAPYGFIAGFGEIRRTEGEKDNFRRSWKGQKNEKFVMSLVQSEVKKNVIFNLV